MSSTAYGPSSIKWSSTVPPFPVKPTGSKRLRKMVKKALEDDRKGRTEKWP